MKKNLEMQEMVEEIKGILEDVVNPIETVVEIAEDDLTKSIDTIEKFRLVDQMIRCSRSITNNIAEGYGRFHFKENAQFCRQSR